MDDCVYFLPPMLYGNGFDVIVLRRSRNHTAVRFLDNL